MRTHVQDELGKWAYVVGDQYQSIRYMNNTDDQINARTFLTLFGQDLLVFIESTGTRGLSNYFEDPLNPTLEECVMFDLEYNLDIKNGLLLYKKYHNSSNK